MFTAFIAGCIFYQQFVEMNAQTGFQERAAKQTRIDSQAASLATGRQLALMQKQLLQQQVMSESTGKQLSIMQKQLLQQRDTSEKQLRPYIFLQSMDLTQHIVPLTETPVTNSYINGGETPAFDVHTENTNQNIIDGTEPKFIFKTPTSSNVTIAPKGTYDVLLKIDPLTPVQVAQYNAGTRHVYMVGQITYSDVFHRTHHTRYCIVFDPSTGHGIACHHPGQDD